MGKKSSKTTTGPSKQALPYLQQGSNAVTAAYNGNAGNIASIESLLQNNMGQVADNAFSNPTLDAAAGYDQDVLSGKYLTGNPYLDKMVAQTNADVTDAVNAGVGTRGITGGSAQTQLLANELAKNETNLRYNDYTAERNNMNTAAGNAASITGAKSSAIASLLQYLTAQAGIPTSAANDYAQALAALWGNSKTTTQTQPWGPQLAGLIGSGLSGWASGGFAGI